MPGEPTVPPGVPSDSARIRFARPLGVGVRTALAGGTILGLLESWMMLSQVSTRFEETGHLPFSYSTGAVARGVLTHMLFWIVCGLIYSLPVAAWIRRRRRKQTGLPPECFHLPAFILVAGCVVIPPDLYLLDRLDSVHVVVASLSTLVLAAIVFFFSWWAADYAWFRVYRAALKWSPAGCALLAAGCLVGLYRSPFCGPGTFKVPDAETRFPPRTTGPPNFLWIVMDTVRADHLSCYGYERPTTPFLEKLAAESVVYDRAVSNSYWTVPSHASMFTGLPVRQHGATHESAWLDDEHLTIAELLQERGYLTASFSNNPHISDGRNYTQGFEHYPQVHQLAWLERMSLSLWCKWLGIVPPVPWLEWDQGAALANAYITGWLDEVFGRGDAANKPWMVFVNYMEAHLPYTAPRPRRRLMMDDSGVVRSYALHYRVYGEIIGRLLLHFNMLDNDAVQPRDRQILRDLYDASLSYLDSRIEELVRVFDQRGLLANTVIIVTSDHGESLGEHRRWGHECGLYDTLVRVPLMIRHPGVSRRGRVDYPVLTSDLFPTMAAWAGAPLVPRSAHDSQDLNRLSETAASERIVVSEYQTPALLPVYWAEKQDPNFRRGPYVRQQRAVVQGRHKYIWGSDNRHELYDLSADVGETRNLITDEPGIAGRLDSGLRAWERALPPYTYPKGRKMPDLPRDIVRQLKGLGYMR